MSFGFSAGDCLATLQLARKLRKDFKGAPKQFESLSKETKTLSKVLKDVNAKAHLTPQQKANLEQAVSTCRDVLDDLQDVRDRFSDLVTSRGHSRRSVGRVWKQLKWDPSEAHELRMRISSSVAMLSTLCNQISGEAVVSMKGSVDRMKLRQDDQDRLAILNWLSSFDHMAQQSDISSRKQAGTGGWLLDSPEYTSWKSTKGKTLLCLGIPGAGKTILSSIVVEELMNQFQHESNVCVSYVYFNHHQQENQTAIHVFSNLLRQLVAGRSGIPAHVEHLYRQHSKGGSQPTLEQVRNLLRGFSSLYSRVFIIVDAIDECPTRDGRRNTLLTQLMKLQDALSANFMYTSRPIPEIEARFPKIVPIRVRASEHDVQKYLDGQMGRLPGFVSRSPKLQEQIKKQIALAVGGMFLLAHLHLESLMYKSTSRALVAALEGLSHGSTCYDDMYEMTMKRVQTQPPDQAALAKDVLQWIVCAKSSLTVSGIRHALAVEPGREDLDLDNLPDADDMVTACGGLVAVDQESGIISLTHYTAQQYFERTRDTWFPTAENHMAEVCLTYLSFHSFRGQLCKTWDQYWGRLRDWPFYQHAFLSSLQPLFQGEAVAISERRKKRGEPFDPVWVRITELHMAAFFGLVSVVSELAVGRNVNEQAVEGSTPLAFAADRGHDAVIRLLLVDHGADSNISNRNGVSPLHRAVYRHDATSSRLLLETGKADMWLKDSNGVTPLCTAILDDQVEIVEIFIQSLETGQDFESQLGLVLRTASARGRVGIVKLLISQSTLDLDVCGGTMLQRTKDERSPLAWASRYGQYQVCKMLVETGRVNVDAVDSTGRTALSYTTQETSAEIRNLLLQANTVGADSAGSEDDQSPLSRSFKQGKERTMKKPAEIRSLTLNIRLVKLTIFDERPHHAFWFLRGQIFNAKQGSNALSHAAKHGRIKVVETLLTRYKVHVNLKNFEGRTALSYAAECGHEGVVQALLKAPDIDLDSRSDSNSGRFAGCTPLALAAYRGHARIVQMLLDTSQVDPDSKSDIESLRRTPLTWAISGASELSRGTEGHEAVVGLLLRTRRVDVKPLLFATWHPQVPLAIIRLLLENGADPNATPDHGETPLSNAFETERVKVIDILLKRGADVNVTWDDGKTPLSIAMQAEHKDVVDLLLKYGAKLAE
ncbi:hypothetical protein N0V84_010155 [Fusarium piperis]|uniref:NACHT domain-containing protein n=1 Tax=Fusarium piperis TaxID=1435070 RepID=A0A9W9BGZ5_9HYPO|nr:hypothetical protein N0V84_010155 [Fusarium piperis]